MMLLHVIKGLILIFVLIFLPAFLWISVGEFVTGYRLADKYDRRSDAWRGTDGSE